MIDEEIILSDMPRPRGVESPGVNDVLGGAILMYCRHKKIACKFEPVDSRHVKLMVDPRIIESDPILSELHVFFNSNRIETGAANYWEYMCKENDDDFNSHYAARLDSLIKTFSSMMGRRENMEYIQPRSVTEIICYFLRKHGVKSLYNPFAGLCSYPITMGSDCDFYAQDINQSTIALARIRLEANGLNPDSIHLEDSIRSWKGYGYDAIVASAPFGLRVPIETIQASLMVDLPRTRMSGLPRFSVSTIEDLFLYFATGRSGKERDAHYPKSVVATIVPQSFMTRPSSSGIREMLCNDGTLDTVVELPSGIFPNTSIRASIIVLNPSEKHSSVRFVDTTSCLMEGGSAFRVLDWQKVISIIDSENPEFVKTISYDELSHQDYVLYGDNYLPASTKCEDGHKIMSLADLLERVPETRIRYTQQVNLLPVEAFSNKVLDILHPNTSLLSQSTIDNGYMVTGPCVGSHLDYIFMVYVLHPAPCCCCYCCC